ncbi:uncharacterized protein LOC143852397 [Tasmannia lanceolata]|uniref:uncharacterized protein LOC143852397 n=1 Tax=Tasmannia lanceolata TaxID=3420 RepID=UPI00406372E6
MVVLSIRSLVVAILVSGIVVSLGNGVWGQGCDVGALVSQCGKFVQIPGPPTTPSPECCAQVQKTDFPCACKSVTKAVELVIRFQWHDLGLEIGIKAALFCLAVTVAYNIIYLLNMRLSFVICCVSM